MQHARPMMEYLFEQVRHSGSLVLLADRRGVILDTVGDADFCDKVERVSLKPGASWSEQHRGTNAVGLALIERSPIEISGGEHFLDRLAFLYCGAAPICNPQGEIVGVLDISCDRRNMHPHTGGLVKTAAQTIENQFFASRYRKGIRLRLHGHPYGIGTPGEGMLALSEDGWIVGANQVALKLLGLCTADIGATPLTRLFDIDFGQLLDWGRHRHDAVLPLHTVRGQVVYAALNAGKSPIAGSSMTAEAKPDALGQLDTGDSRMAAVIQRARKLAGKAISIIVCGESGVGKEVFARALHEAGPRRQAPFVAVNCAGLPDTLIEAELFGYAPGAYTGARRDGSPGRIREAHGGTLFLDEIGDMPLAMQARLLRVLQDKCVTPLGGGKSHVVDFSLVCATHRDLAEEVAAGRFRADLYFRINGLSLMLPPLRERSDFGNLLRALLTTVSDGRPLNLAPEIANAFARYRWPGNLRQLANVLRTAVALTDDDTTQIGWDCLPDDVVAAVRRRGEPMDVERTGRDLRTSTDTHIRATLEAAAGNVSEAARRLGIGRNTLYRRLRRMPPT